MRDRFVTPPAFPTCKHCGLAAGQTGDCQEDVPKVRGQNIQDAKTDQGFQILTASQLAEIQRLRRSSGYGHN